MLTEQDVVDAVPHTGFVWHYLQHAEKQTTSPLAYHLGMAMSLLAVTSPPELGIRYAGSLHGNVFVLLVGRSGMDRKSSALNVGRELLQAVDEARIGSYPGSEEGLVESVAGQQTQVILMSEFGKFLANAQRGYFEKIKTTLTDLWDCSPQTRRLAKGKIMRAGDPRLSIAAACSIPYLEKHTLTEDWTGGFMGRWMVMYAREERVDPFPEADMSLFEPLCEFLKARSQIESISGCTGLSYPAKKLWEDWFMRLQNTPFSAKIGGLKSRVPTMALKAALLYAWDWGIPLKTGGPWELDVAELDYGIKFAELHLRSVVSLSEIIADHPDARLRRQVVDAIQVHDGVATLGQILGVLKMRKRPVIESLESLMEEGQVEMMCASTGTMTYILKASPRAVLGPLRGGGRVLAPSAHSPD